MSDMWQGDDASSRADAKEALARIMDLPTVRSTGQQEGTAAGVTCPGCPYELTRVSINSHFAYLCNNWRCRLYKHPQHYEARPVSEPGLTKWRNRSASYRQQRENYRKLRAAGIGCVEASRMTSNKQTKLALEAKGIPL